MRKIVIFSALIFLGLSVFAQNNDKNAPEFGYYFFSEDFLRLKIMSFTIHKDAVKEVLVRFK